MRASDIRRGQAVIIDGKLFVVTNADHNTPGNLRAKVQFKLRDVSKGTIQDKRVGATDDIQTATLDRRQVEYLYSDNEGHVLMDLETYDQNTIPREVFGDDMGVVIGKHGNTINALQYLVGLIAHKRVGERVRVVVDAEGYRGRREQTLRELARSYADRVKETGQEAVLDALQSYERRIVHTALADDPDVITYSEGEEPDRRVVISPREAGEADEGVRE